MRWFKTMTTNHHMRGVREQGWAAFQAKFWQRSYHDPSVRSEAELNRLREYSLTNPARWADDRLYAAS
jgi:REP element-mobilizing transposase RayT